MSDDYLRKTVSLERMAAICDAARADGRRCVLAHGIFDIIHPGHTRHLQWARRQGDVLFVTVAADGPGIKTRTPAAIRVENLCALAMVDHVAEIGCLDATESIERLHPDVLVRGMEFHGSQAEVATREQALLESYGGELLLSSGDPAYSSIHTAELEGSYLRSRQSVLHQVLERDAVAPARFEEILDRFESLDVLVVGDSIVEDYVHSDALGMDVEDPVIVVRPKKTERFVGGAAGLAEHVVGLGANAELFTVVGDDGAAEFLRRRGESSRATYRLFGDATRPTTLKQRFLGGRKKLLRANYFEEHPIRDRLADEIIAQASERLAEADLLLLWDGSYGAIADALRERLIRNAREVGTRVAAMSPCSTQISSVERYRDIDFIVTTEREVRMACWDTSNSVVELGQRLLASSGNEGLVVTLGENGTLVLERDGRREYLPKVADDNPLDPLGATDAMLAATALGRGAGGTFVESAILGSLAYSEASSRVGNRALESDALRARLLETLYAGELSEHRAR